VLQIDEYLWRLDLNKSFPARSPPWELEEKPSSPDAHYNGAEATIWNVGMGAFTTIGGWFSIKHGPYGDLYGAPYFDQSQNFKLPSARMFTYDVRNRTWASTLLDQGVRRISTASWVSNKRLRRGYVLGGVIITEESNGLPNVITDTWLNTMTQYDFEKKEWNREHLPAEIGETVDGGLIALDRVGEDGVLLFLGGEQKDGTGARSWRSMEKMWIYNIKNSTWYSQITTGEIPVGRRQSCFFMVPAPDLSSYQIYTFSGALQEEPATLLDLYVLTIPGFIWKKISLTDAGYPDTYPMNAHQCSLHQHGRQILIVPGNINANKNTTDTTAFTYLCNNGTGIKVFDTLEWKFKSDFDPILTTLGVPKPIVDLIGGTTSGGANVTTPKRGWQHSSLGVIFKSHNEPIMYDDDDIVNTPSTHTRNSRLSKGASVGIGVGGLIGLICISGLLFWWRCAFRGDKDEETSHRAELCAQRDPVEAQGNTARQELSAGYQPPELMHMQGGNFVYSPKPNEYQSPLGQGHDGGGELLPGIGPVGVPRAPGPMGTMESDYHIHVR